MKSLFPQFDHQAKELAPTLPPSLLASYPESVRERFSKFHAANPQVYDLFRASAFRMRQTGRERYSARTIMESIRWDYDLRTTGEVFSINDQYTPIYVRLLIYQHPEFAEFFELRTVRSKGRISQEQRARENQ